MTKYVSLVNLRLESSVAWRLEHFLRNSNEKADSLVAVAASLPIKVLIQVLKNIQIIEIYMTNN